jgi:hypothetical protein
VQITKQILTSLKVMPMLEAVAVPFFSQHVDKVTGAFDPGPTQEQAAAVMLDELVKWAEALRPMRAAPKPIAAPAAKLESAA